MLQLYSIEKKALCKLNCLQSALYILLLISATGGRFPRAWLQPPRRFAPAGSSAQAFPAGVAALHSNQLESGMNHKFNSSKKKVGK